MVWGVCRRTLRRSHDAEDAFQATFLVLVRRAAAVVPPERVGNWLYGVAHRTARKARATAAKRASWEKQVTLLPEPAAEQAEPAGDAKQIAGRWKLSAFGIDGARLTGKELADYLAGQDTFPAEWAFTDEHLEWPAPKPDLPKVRIPYRLDEKANPKQIDVGTFGLGKDVRYPFTTRGCTSSRAPRWRSAGHRTVSRGRRTSRRSRRTAESCWNSIGCRRRSRGLGPAAGGAAACPADGPARVGYPRPYPPRHFRLARRRRVSKLYAGLGS